LENTTRVAIVTGAARGLGRATAVRLAREGLQVAVADLDAASCAETVEEITADGGKALTVSVDVADRAQVEDLVRTVASTLGPPLVLVNNAGITRDNLIFKMKDSDWEDVIGVHLKGAFLMVQATQAHMVEAKWGRIINLSSTAALGNRGQANYSAAKSGLQGFTKTLAIELGPFGITTNAVAPGFIATEMTDSTARRLGKEPEQHRADVAANIPVRRVGLPKDIANAVAFFASEHSGFVNGQVLYVAGGPRG
jgi:3-oxoacyl-[acyl-carrier protein] reductase